MYGANVAEKLVTVIVTVPDVTGTEFGVTFETMIGAKPGKPLPMDKFNRNPKDRLGFNAGRMFAGEQSAQAGRVRPLAEAMHELRARSK